MRTSQPTEVADLPPHPTERDKTSLGASGSRGSADAFDFEGEALGAQPVHEDVAHRRRRGQDAGPSLLRPPDTGIEKAATAVRRPTHTPTPEIRSCCGQRG